MEQAWPARLQQVAQVAKWAEQDIVLKQRIAKVQAEADPQDFAEHRRQFQDEMKQVRDGIFAERDEKIEEIRQSA